MNARIDNREHVPLQKKERLYVGYEKRMHQNSLLMHPYYLRIIISSFKNEYDLAIAESLIFVQDLHDFTSSLSN